MRYVVAFFMVAFVTGLLLMNAPMVMAQELPVPREEALFMEAGGSEVYDKFNPFIPAGTPGGASGYLLMENLWYDDWITGERRWWLATGYKYSEDYKTFTIYIRKGVTWNDGVPFTAKDVAFTINMVKDTPGLYWHLTMKDAVESVEVPDDYTVVIKLKEPNPRFHIVFVKIWPFPIVAEHVWKGQDPLTFKNWPPVWTGPYKLYRVIPELRMWIWIRNENYWGKKFGYFPAPKYVICRLTPPSLDIDFKDIVGNYIDVANGIITDYRLVDLAKHVNPELQLTPVQDVGGQLGGSRGIYVNCGKYTLNLREVRWAIAYAIDRKKICDVTYKGYAVPMWTDRAPGIKKFPYLLKVYEKYPLEYNPDKANAILDALGFKRGPDGIRVTPNGTRLSFELTVPGAWPEARSNALIVAENLKEVGIEIKVTEVIGAQYVERRELGHFDMFCQWGIGWIIDPLESLTIFHSKYYVPIGERAEYQYIRWKNSTFDKVLDELSKIGPDHPDAPKLYEKLFEIWISELPIIPLVHHQYAFLFSTKYWVGWPTPENLYCNPMNWVPDFLHVVLSLKPAPKVKPPPVITYVTVYITADVEAFTGIDGKTYGPYKPGDAALVPKEDAERLIAEGVASLTPPPAPVPKELPEIAKAVSKLEIDVAGLKKDIAALSEAVKGLVKAEDIKALKNAIDGIYSVVYVSVGVSAITLILVLATLAIALKRRG